MKMNEDEDDSEPIAKNLSDKATETIDNSKSITRSIHIATRNGEVTVTTQDVNENIEMIRKIAEKLIDKYLVVDDKSSYTQ